MTMLRRVLAVALVGLAAVSLVATEAASADTGSDELDLAARINGVRAARGLAPLAVKGELFDVARAWSGRMADAGAISHNPSLAAEAPSTWTRLGENVGTGADVAELFQAFLNSPSHYANIVDPGFDSVGVGVVRNPAGQMLVSMTFMSSGPAPALVRKVVRVCSRNRKGRTVCVRRAQMVRA